MQTEPVTPASLAASVIAVPPLARDDDYQLHANENQRIVQHLESGGITTLLYGGNAIMYHVALTEFEEVLSLLADMAGESTLMIPSIGPTFGMMVDQAAVLHDFDFPTVMILPQPEVSDSDGIATAVYNVASVLERPILLYIKHDRYLDVDAVQHLMNDGLLSAIKYAVVRDDPAEDQYLRALVDAVGTERLVSGMGEQPAIIHMRQYGLVGFTSGCVCVAPGRSMEMLRAVQAEDFTHAEELRQRFRPLEDLRNQISPIRVLHTAVEEADIARTGPVMPLLSEVTGDDRTRIGEAARQLRAWEEEAEASDC